MKKKTNNIFSINRSIDSISDSFSFMQKRVLPMHP